MSLTDPVWSPATGRSRERRDMSPKRYEYNTILMYDPPRGYRTLKLLSCFDHNKYCLLKLSFAYIFETVADNAKIPIQYVPVLEAVLWNRIRSDPELCNGSGSGIIVLNPASIGKSR